MKAKSAILGLSLAFAAMSSQAVVIDFETATTDVFTDPQTHQGFDWEFSAAGWFVGPHDTAFCPSCTSNGTSNLVAAGGTSANVVMTSTGGGTFDIFSLDAATANSTELNQLSIVGTLFGGGSVSQTVSIDGTFDSYTLAGFVGLTSVTFSSVNSGSYNFGGFSIDNIGLSALVPVPGSLALLGLGLLVLGFRSRRKSLLV